MKKIPDLPYEPPQTDPVPKKKKNFPQLILSLMRKKAHSGYYSAKSTLPKKKR